MRRNWPSQAAIETGRPPCSLGLMAFPEGACGSDSEGIRSPAGRAQWISSPSPWPLGHTVSGVLGKETEAWWLLVRKSNAAVGQTLVKSTGRSCVAWGHRRRGHHPSTDTRCLCRETCSEALALQRCLVGSDSEGIRTPAGRAQWISSPSPWPLGHTVSGDLWKQAQRCQPRKRTNHVA